MFLCQDECRKRTVGNICHFSFIIWGIIFNVEAILQIGLSPVSKYKQRKARSHYKSGIKHKCGVASCSVQLVKDCSSQLELWECRWFDAMDGEKSTFQRSWAEEQSLVLRSPPRHGRLSEPNWWIGNIPKICCSQGWTENGWLQDKSYGTWAMWSCHSGSTPLL